MADQVQEVKQRADIVSVVGSRVELKPAGKYLKGLCPFHSEKSPSFFVSPELQIFKCYGCGKAGDVFSFLQEYEGMTFREALEDLADKVGIKLQSYQPNQTEQLTGDLKQILNLAAEYYHYLLAKHAIGKPAREYLKQRQVSSVLVDKFGLGFAPNSWHSLEKYLTQKKHFSPDLVEQAGLVIGNHQQQRTNYYDRFRNRIMFPLTDFRGQVVGFSGRTLSADTKEAKYINTPETKLYRKRELLFGIDQARSMIRKKNEVILVEGEFDVISSVAAGVAHVAGIKGSAVTEEHVRLLMRLTKNLTLCLDADSAGDAATKRGIELADSLGMNVSVLALKTNKDPDEIARSQPKKWQALVKQSQSIYDFYIDSAFDKHSISSGVGKKLIAAELVPVLAKISNVVEQDHYLQLVARKLKVDTNSLRAEITKHLKAQDLPQKGKTEADSATKPPSSTSDPLERIERQIWTWWLQLDPTKAQEHFHLLQRDWIHPGLKRLSQLTADLVDEIELIELKTYIHQLPKELQQLVQHLYLENVTTTPLSLDQVVQLIAQSDKLIAKRRLHQLTQQISNLEQQDSLTESETQKLTELQQTVSNLIQQLHTQTDTG